MNNTMNKTILKTQSNILKNMKFYHKGNCFNYFADDHMIFLNKEIDNAAINANYKDMPIIERFFADAFKTSDKISCGFYPDEIKNDIKALKATKQKFIILKVNENKYIKYTLKYFNDILRYCNYKGSRYISFSICDNVNTKNEDLHAPSIFCNESSACYLLPVRDEKIAESYKKQNDILESYYKTLKLAAV